MEEGKKVFSLSICLFGNSACSSCQCLHFQSQIWSKENEYNVVFSNLSLKPDIPTSVQWFSLSMRSGALVGKVGAAPICYLCKGHWFFSNSFCASKIWIKLSKIWLDLHTEMTEHGVPPFFGRAITATHRRASGSIFLCCVVSYWLAIISEWRANTRKIPLVPHLE